MNILLLKLGMHYNPYPECKHAALGEVDSIRTLFLKNNHRVDILTDKEYCNDYCKDANTFTIDGNVAEYDLLVIVNGQITDDIDEFNRYQYSLINSMQCPAVFILCDLALSLRKMNIIRDDIACVTQAQFTQKLEMDILKNHDLYNFKRIEHFPFQKFPLLTQDVYAVNNNPTYDLLYGGGFRKGRRTNKMLKYYFDVNEYNYNNYNNVNAAMFGNINIEMFSNERYSYKPTFLPSVDYDEFPTIMNDSFATVYISDDSYSKYGSYSQRICECAMANCISFIDIESDINKLIFGDSIFLRNTLYVSDIYDVKDKLNMIKCNYEYRALLCRRTLKHLTDDNGLQIFRNFYVYKFNNLIYDLIT